MPAINHIIKTIIDRGSIAVASAVCDIKDIEKTVKKCNADCAVICDITAGRNFAVPRCLAEIPVVLVTNNPDIINQPKRYGLYDAIKSSSGGSAGLALFEKQLNNALESIYSSRKKVPHINESYNTSAKKPKDISVRQQFIDLNTDDEREVNQHFIDLSADSGKKTVNRQPADSGADTSKKAVNRQPADSGADNGKKAVNQQFIDLGADAVSNKRQKPAHTAKPQYESGTSGSGEIALIAIGASTGGTDAIIEVVKDLPAYTPPVVIVQHMPEGFTKMYSDRLDRICKMSAKEAEDGDRLRQGLIIVAHGGQQMEVKKDANGYYISSKPGEKVSGHCPSVDVLFRSVAKIAGKEAIGVILTGMGRDGAYGLGDMRRAGSFTIGQDEKSCVVYGMPCVAFNEGAVARQAPLDEIGNIIISMIK